MEVHIMNITLNVKVEIDTAIWGSQFASVAQQNGTGVPPKDNRRLL